MWPLCDLWGRLTCEWQLLGRCVTSLPSVICCHFQCRGWLWSLIQLAHVALSFSIPPSLCFFSFYLCSFRCMGNIKSSLLKSWTYVVIYYFHNPSIILSISETCPYILLLALLTLSCPQSITCGCDTVHSSRVVDIWHPYHVLWVWVGQQGVNGKSFLFLHIRGEVLG